MALAAVITDIRKKNGLTQDAFASKLFVTRQAVSRWENGETTPSVETLKTISELFGVDGNAFFGGGAGVCQSCGMPLKSLDELGAQADGGVNPEYCKYCYGEGKFLADVTLDEMVETNLKYLDEFNKENGFIIGICDGYFIDTGQCVWSKCNYKRKACTVWRTRQHLCYHKCRPC